MLKQAIAIVIYNIPCMAFAGLTYMLAKSGHDGFAVLLLLLAFFSLNGPASEGK